MKGEEFFTRFTKYIKSKDNHAANMVLMEELGSILVNQREDFIYVLKFSGVNVPDEKFSPVTDVDLINLYLKNVDKNRKLILGTAYLISHNNKMTNFDGSEYTSSTCADAINKSMVSYFCGCSRSSFDGDFMSNFEGDPDCLSYNDSETKSYADDVGAIAAGIGSLAGLGAQIAKNKGAKDPLAALQQKQAAKDALIQGAVDAKKQQLANAGKESDAAAAAEKSKRTKMIIIGASVGVVLLTAAAIIIVKVVKSRKAKAA